MLIEVDQQCISMDGHFRATSTPTLTEQKAFRVLTVLSTSSTMLFGRRPSDSTSAVASLPFSIASAGVCCSSTSIISSLMLPLDSQLYNAAQYMSSARNATAQAITKPHIRRIFSAHNLCARPRNLSQTPTPNFHPEPGPRLGLSSFSTIRKANTHRADRWDLQCISQISSVSVGDRRSARWHSLLHPRAGNQMTREGHGTKGTSPGVQVRSSCCSNKASPAIKQARNPTFF